jgi:hypothetical protein
MAGVIAYTNNCEVVSTGHGCYVRCHARGCTYVSEYADEATARRWAAAHDAGDPDDGRAS